MAEKDRDDKVSVNHDDMQESSYWRRMQSIKENEFGGTAIPAGPDRNAEYDLYEHDVQHRNMKTRRSP